MYCQWWMVIRNPLLFLDLIASTLFKTQEFTGISYNCCWRSLTSSKQVSKYCFSLKYVHLILYSFFFRKTYKFYRLSNIKRGYSFQHFSVVYISGRAGRVALSAHQSPIILKIIAGSDVCWGWTSGSGSNIKLNLRVRFIHCFSRPSS